MTQREPEVADMHIVVACLQDQHATVRETLPSLMSAAVYADKLTVVAFEADTLIELADFHPIYDAFSGFFDYIGADSYDLANESRRSAGSGDDVDDYKPGVSDEEWEARYQAEAARDVLAVVDELLVEPNTYPFVYDPAGVLINDSIELSRLSRNSKERAEADARLGTGLIDKVPSFDQLGVEEVLAVRAELRDLLIPFRGFVSETSTALEGTGHDEEAIADVVHEVYVGKVRPILSEINGVIARSGFFRTLLRDFGRDPKGVATSFVTFGLGAAVHLPTYATLSAAASTELLRVKHEALEQRREATANRLYYLHELDEYAGQSSR